MGTAWIVPTFLVLKGSEFTDATMRVFRCRWRCAATGVKANLGDHESNWNCRRISAPPEMSRTPDRNP